MLRRPIACALLLWYLAACTTWHVEKGVSPSQLISTKHPTAVRLNLADGWLLPISAGEHRQIVKAIASGDPEAAGRAMFDHVIESKERTIKNNLKQQANAAQAAAADVRPLKRKDSP